MLEVKDCWRAYTTEKIIKKNKKYITWVLIVPAFLDALLNGEEKKDRPLLINNKQFIRPNPVETESPEEDQKSQFLHVLFLTQC